jgi:hypothetical protein
LPTTGLEVNDKKIAEHLRTMRSRWGAGFANPHGAPAEPSWVSGPKRARVYVSPPKIKYVVNVANRSPASGLPPKSGKPDAAMVQRAPGFRALQPSGKTARAKRPGEKEHPTARE